jgi:glycerol-3-phosphate acyltransferase PlsX
MKLIVDVMGENPVKKIINGLRKFKSIHSDVELIILGNENEIKNTLTDKDQFTIVNCDKAVTPESHLPSILRDKETSMYKGLSMVQNNEADGMLSAGYTPAYVTLSHLLIKPINGINKPAFMSYVPTSNNRGFIFLDVGANINCSGEDLYQFAIMANIYSKTIRKIENPAINVLNIGTEETKGFEFHKNANELLKNDKSLNYQGFIESRELSSGITDIVVCDGYSGNLGLKALEGCLLAINSLLKKEYKKPKN